MSQEGILPLIYGLMKKTNPDQMDKNQFSHWLSGFIDGEANFQVFMDRQYLRAAFRIRLHSDDISTLYKIKEFLGVGNVTVNGSNCLYTISDLYSLKTVLLPFLDEYNLLTSKWLDYLDFKSVVNYLYTTGSSRLSAEKLAWASTIINGMNSGRTVFNRSLMPAITINPFWLLGFIEAEGTFGLKNLSPYFQLAQHSNNSSGSHCSISKILRKKVSHSV